MTSEYRIRELESQNSWLRQTLERTMDERDKALEERDRARETATRLEQELSYITRPRIQAGV